MEIIKQPVFFEQSMKIKKCHRDNCEGDLKADEIYLRTDSGRKVRYSCKKCALCGTNYLDCGLYSTIKNKEQLEVLNSDIEVVVQTIEQRRKKKLDKKWKEHRRVSSLPTLEDKRYTKTSMERSFIQIDINKLRK